MVFSSPIFLFGFLPIILFAYYVFPRSLKNMILLLGSLFFYTWGEVFYALVMVASILLNYLFGALIGCVQGVQDHSLIRTTEQSTQDQTQNRTKTLSGGVHQRRRKTALSIGILVNLSLLVVFKYANFFVDNLNHFFGATGIGRIELSAMHLPLGISFFTFQAISYLVDVYRGQAPVQKNFINLALYISSFPQLIAGPIIRYQSVVHQITGRLHSAACFSEGVQRFVFGLAKKMLIANPLGLIADRIFVLPADQLTIGITWLGVVCYSLQIFFDFCGYSDMAIGLGRMFGFHFLENFNYPYISRSIQEFWRRWHISLSTWFRDYLYIPLGGSRVPAFRVYFNLCTVFFLCGLWHGASWNFVIWGLIHGSFIIFERICLNGVLKKIWSPLTHAYTLIVVMVAWVFFRADTMPYALRFLAVMFGFESSDFPVYNIRFYLDHESSLALLIGILFCMPVSQQLNKLIYSKYSIKAKVQWTPRLAIVMVLLVASLLKISSSTYNPFIYFRF